MAQLVVRNLENAVKAKLRRRARRHGRSMEEEVRDILRSVANDDDDATLGLGSDISRLFAKAGLDSEVAELRGYKIRPAGLEP